MNPFARQCGAVVQRLRSWFLERDSIQGSLLGLMAACLTPALGISGYLVHENYVQQRARLEQESVLQARALAAALDRELSNIIAGLRVLSTSPALAAGELRAFQERAREALAFQLVDNYVLSDSLGRQHLNTLRDFGTPLPRTGSPPELLRVFETAKPVVSGLFVGPLTGRAMVAVGVPVFRGGEVAFTLNSGLGLQHIAALLERQPVPPQWVAAVLDGSGTIVARSRDAQTYVGQKATDELIRLLALNDAEGMVFSNTKDGIPTYAGFVRSSVSDWRVVVGAPRAAVEVALMRSIAWLLAAAIAAYAMGILFALRLGLRVSTSIQGLIEPALALGNGQPMQASAPMHLREAEALAQAMQRAGRVLESTRHLAQHDPLTGLPNRMFFDELLASRITASRRKGTSLALLAVDLDGFKAVNDTHGHAAGDALLKIAARRFSEALRASDVVARIGGDEFAVLLEDQPADDACRVAVKLIEALSLPYPGVLAPVSASIGIALLADGGLTAADLSANADAALYAAKRAGKRRVCVHARSGGDTSCDTR